MLRDILWIFNKNALQYAVFSIIEIALRLRISKGKTSEDTNSDRNAVWPIAGIGVREVFFVEANGLEVDPLLTDFRPDLLDDYGFFRSF